jgi:hypothetical protein
MDVKTSWWEKNQLFQRMFSNTFWQSCVGWCSCHIRCYYSPIKFMIILSGPFFRRWLLWWRPSLPYTVDEALSCFVSYVILQSLPSCSIATLEMRRVFSRWWRCRTLVWWDGNNSFSQRELRYQKERNQKSEVRAMETLSE